jgi:Fe-Mn family superoxide dismutase
MFKEAKFEIPDLKGITKKNIEEHLKLYSGYVKNANLVLEKIDELAKDSDLPEQAGKNAYILGELQRRFSFEFNGIVNHENYFEQFFGGHKTYSVDSDLKRAVEETWGSFDAWLNRFKGVALTRGIGWAILYYDPTTKQLLNAWIDEQHLGQLNGCKTILALDMWEHSYVADYQPSGKKQYIEDFFSNLNWQIVENRFLKS